MVTPAGPACDHCHQPFNKEPCFVGFACTHFRYCCRLCLLAADAERTQRARSQQYALERHRSRHWKVVDGNGALVCVTVYKKGALEVIRRLSDRPSVFHLATGASRNPDKRTTTPSAPPQDIYRQKGAPAA